MIDERQVRHFALQNAIKFDGKTNPGVVIGRLLGADPTLKNEMKTVSALVQKIVKEVNSMKLVDQIQELEQNAPELLEEKKHEKREGLKQLPNAVQGKVVLRMAPSPSGPLHIGHALVLSLNVEYARMYGGKCFIRIDDTNADNIYPPAYDLIPADARWLSEGLVTETVCQSDRLGAHYDAAEKLVNQGHAYVCTCDPDTFRTLINKMEACPCRALPVKEHLQRWAQMFSSYKPGEAVLRIKTDIQHKNPAMRDWPAFRINDHAHAKAGTEFRVWTLMNFAVAIDDHDLGITHTIRGKDHMDNERRQKFIFDFFGWTPPTHLYFGRINFEGLELSCSKTKLKIEEGKYSGWDDIRLPFLPALRKRGYHPGAFRKLALSIGASQTDKTMSGEDFFKSLNAFNKDMIDDATNRYFFVADPKKIVVRGAPKQAIDLLLHPEHEERGKRKLYTHENFFIAGTDAAALKDEQLYRLMDCLNFVMKKNELLFDSLEYEHYKEKGERIMHWLSEDTAIKVHVLMPDLSRVTGLGEQALKKLDLGTVVQFERFGFVRLEEKKSDQLLFWFLHK